MKQPKKELPKHRMKKQFITSKKTYNVGDDFQSGNKAVIDFLKLNKYI